MKTLSAGAAAIALTTAFATLAPTPAMAQSTTSDVRGVVTDPSGAPVAGASVSIRDRRTGAARTVRTGSGGVYTFRGLNVTGDYTISIDSDQYADQSVSNVTLSLGDTTVVNFGLAGASTDDEIIVVASRSSAIDIATGPAATFDFNDLQNTPAISRDIKDIIRTDPRVFIDESFGNGLQCAGASPRFNSLTVDGIKLNDNFGLNSNGYPTERLPFPFDAINQVAVELAPFDVEYGGFTGCNINAVTRSGENEFHGSAWGDYTNDSLRGGSIEGSEFDKGNFRKVRFGATLSGPIIKDKLFFFAAYEKFNDVEVLARGPAEAGAIGTQGVSQAQLDRIADIARTVYGYDVIPLPANFDESDEKILVKLDYNINDNHRASFTYNRNDGNNITASDGDPNEYEFFDHYYLRGTTINSYSGQIFSNWTDNLSTEARVSFTKNDTRQESVGGTDFGEVRINTFNNGERASVYLGADDSRHSNKLDTETFNIKLKGDYSINNHLITLGYEREELEVFNLFVQQTEGEYRFDRVGTSGLALDPDANIDDFEIQLADDIHYGNAGGTNVPEDAAANFGFVTNTAYLQDEFVLDEYGLTITAGLRYDWYTSSDVPTLNANFLARNGFDNTSTFDGKGLLQPRVGINYEAADNLTLRAGAGIFSGGNPNVWLANSYQNDGTTTIQLRVRDIDLTGLTFVEDEGGSGRPIYGVPQFLFDDVASGTADTGVNAVDPDFNIPSQWKAAFGLTYNFDAPMGFGEGYTLQADFLYTKDRDAATIIDATLEQVGTGPDGRPIYRQIDRADPDCVDPLAAACGGRRFNQDFILTNNEGGGQKVISAALSKDYEFANSWRADWTVAYAYTNAKDRNPMTSSVAFSNFVGVQTSDPNNLALATSNYEVPHRITFRAGVANEFFDGYETKFNLFGTISQSRPYSINFTDGGELFGDQLDDRHLLYVPTGPADPNVIFAPGFDTAGFFSLVSELGLDQYAGMIAPRNAFQSEWFSQWDIRIEQEIPGLFKGHNGAAFVILDNVGNLLNDKWGVINQAGFPGRVQLADLDESGLGPNGEYIFTGFNNVDPDSIQRPVTNASVWEIRFGVRYEF
ncbi:MAG: TonB-dependent receptor [Alphaproteobacteria bacterium]|nr:TonB-dependent receptor [Alphaproteobacteria bacterium]